ncbi:hypothetical protein GARC_0934 [Paraglaciecola arctica BSs20135]|uniref:Uncharacterized protein n=1 Tax=Paraglaciecola arctica BSs20135 TaxID=493475 RepID=K6Z3A9_9ALTE|nr:hypothetical protein GARC_0934 [Paraglaciecola arctica BSs20135]
MAPTSQKPTKIKFVGGNAIGDFSACLRSRIDVAFMATTS